MSDSEIERMLVKLIQDHLPEKKSKEALQWLKARTALFKAVERLG